MEGSKRISRDSTPAITLLTVLEYIPVQYVLALRRTSYFTTTGRIRRVIRFALAAVLDRRPVGKCSDDCPLTQKCRFSAEFKLRPCVTCRSGVTSAMISVPLAAARRICGCPRHSRLGGEEGKEEMPMTDLHRLLACYSVLPRPRRNVLVLLQGRGEERAEGFELGSPATGTAQGQSSLREIDARMTIRTPYLASDKQNPGPLPKRPSLVLETPFSSSCALSSFYA